MRYTRRDFGKLALTALPFGVAAGPSVCGTGAGQAELDHQRGARRRDYVQLPHHAGPERGSDAPLRR